MNDIVRIAEITGYDRSKVELIKAQIAPGASDEELIVFLLIAQRSGLDPFSRQIYLIERRENVDGQWKTKRMPQTGIDGLRLVADRTGDYAPGREPTYTYDEQGSLVAATSYVMKYARGQWHEVAATAHYDEYVQEKRDGSPNKMWAEKPHIMLAKCAEALAIRRAFPANLSGLYTSDEIPPDETAPSVAILQAPQPAPRKDSNDLGVLRDALIQRLRALRAIENECIGRAPEFVLDGKLDWSMQIVQLNTEIAASRSRIATWSNVGSDDLSDDDLRDAAITKAAESAADEVPADL